MRVLIGIDASGIPAGFLKSMPTDRCGLYGRVSARYKALNDRGAIHLSKSRQCLAVLLLIIVVGTVHALAAATVTAGYGVAALIVLFASLPFLKRYLD